MTPIAYLIPDMSRELFAVIFYALAAISVVSAIAAATAPKIVHAAFGLMGAFFGVAGLYAMLGSDFLALSQVIVYVGGILILLVFGVLLTGRAKGQLGLEKAINTVPAALAGTALLLGLLLAIHGSDFGPVKNLADMPTPASTVAPIGRDLLAEDQYLFPFEFVSVFLLVSLVGAAYLVRRKRTAS